MKRQGISLIVLVVTIIVLIIITGTVIITGVQLHKGAPLAVFYNDVISMQESVMLKMNDNILKNIDKDNSQLYKWVGIVERIYIRNGSR